MIEWKYEQILHQKHHRSPTRPPMSLWDRAAQFSPFSALAGHAEGTEETARYTQTQRELAPDAQGELEEQLRFLAERLEARPQISATYFRPDPHKEGGDYPTATGNLKSIDLHRRVLIFTDRREVLIDSLVALDSPLF